MKTKELTLCAMMTAILCISAVITIPLPFTPIPITLQVMVVSMCGVLLGKKNGVITIIIYLLLGMVGLPVFSGMQSGPSVIVGPTGGFMIGFIGAVFFTGFLCEKIILNTDSHNKVIAKTAMAMLIGLFIIYFIGTIQFMVVMKTGVIPALTQAVLPFIPMDLFKIALGIILIGFLKRNVSTLSQ